MTTPDYDQITLGPNDVLVLVSKQPMSMEERVRLTRSSVPEPLTGRVAVVDGTAFDAQIVQCGTEPCS